jgi:uncharacterized protein (AIM24 family)
MGETESILARAKELFGQGRYAEAEALLRDREGDEPAILNFRAYLLYKQESFEEAEDAYGRLVEIDSDPSHLVSLGLIRFRLGRIEGARDAFEKALERSPDDTRALRNLGHCYRRLGDMRKAGECFRRAGGDEGSEAPPAGKRSDGADAAGGFTAWLRGNSSSSGTVCVDELPSGSETIFLNLEEKVHLSSRHLISCRGVIVFSPTSRDARRGAAKFGDREGGIVRVEGTGELGLAGRGGNVLAFDLAAEEEVSVNYRALVLYDDGIQGVPSLDLVIPGRFMAVGLRGEGRVMLSLSDAAVQQVSRDYPALVSPASVAAWAGSLSVTVEDGPTGGRGFGRRGGNRFLRFEGDGCLLIQGA